MDNWKIQKIGIDESTFNTSTEIERIEWAKKIKHNKYKKYVILKFYFPIFIRNKLPASYSRFLYFTDYK